MLCFVFAMSIEAEPFLERLEIAHVHRHGRTLHRRAAFERRPLHVIKCGVGPKKASRALDGLTDVPAAVLSVGTAGALSPELRTNEALVITRVTCAWEDTEPIPCSHRLVELIDRACTAEGVAFRHASLVTSRTPVFGREDRRRLREQSGADAVDMETYSLAVLAAERGIPFGALRIVSDDVSTPPLPEYVDARTLWSEVRGFSDRLAAFFRWTMFLRDFRRTVRRLPPILVRVLRMWEQERPA